MSVKIVNIKQITDTIEVNKFCDFYSFPEIIYTSGYAKITSYPLLLDLGEAIWYLKADINHHATLLYWSGKIDELLYSEGLYKLTDLGFKTFDGAYSFKDLIKIKKDGAQLNEVPNWLSTVSWDKAKVTPETRDKIDKELSGTSGIVIHDALTNNDALKVLQKYAEVTKKPIQTSINLLDMIKDLPNSRYFVMYDDEFKPWGLIGGYIDEDNKRAVTTIMKSDGRANAGLVMMAFWLNHLHKDADYKIINHGVNDTAIKQRCGMFKKLAFEIESVKLNSKPTVVNTKSLGQIFGKR